MSTSHSSNAAAHGMTHSDLQPREERRATMSETTTQEQEMRDALGGVGVFWMPDEDAGEGCASWCTTLDPHGEEPADSLADALAKTMQASENDGRRAMLEKVRATLAEHWLTEVECHHESKTDTAHCYCTVWCSGAMPNVGAAVNAWVEHVMEEIAR